MCGCEVCVGMRVGVCVGACCGCWGGVCCRITPSPSPSTLIDPKVPSVPIAELDRLDEPCICMMSANPNPETVESALLSEYPLGGLGWGLGWREGELSSGMVGGMPVCATGRGGDMTGPLLTWRRMMGMEPLIARGPSGVPGTLVPTEAVILPVIVPVIDAVVCDGAVLAMADRLEDEGRPKKPLDLAEVEVGGLGQLEQGKEQGRRQGTEQARDISLIRLHHAWQQRVSPIGSISWGD